MANLRNVFGCALMVCGLATISDQKSLLHAQTSPTKATFDVASVRQDLSSVQPTSNIPLDRVVDLSPTGGSLVARNQPLLAYLIFAYKIQVNEFYGGLMKSLPKWAIDDRFDITAKTDKVNVSKEDFRVMMQALLEERFGFIGHREMRSVPVYLLELSKAGHPGPGLRIKNPSSPCNSLNSSTPPTGSAGDALGFWPATCGDGVDSVLPGSQRLHRTGGRDMTMAQIASWLSGVADLDRQLADNTSLQGKYDFILDYVPEHEGLSPTADERIDAGPTCRQAISDQLGLHIHGGNAQASFFTVDHIEPLKPN